MPSARLGSKTNSAIPTPMPGRIVQVLVAEGDRVRKGQTLVVVEAMKMEHSVCAPTAARIESLNVAEALGERLFALRFDTPSSRRGDFYRILQEVRWELDLRGFQHVKFYVSGGINEADIPGLNPVVDGYGVGTSISNAPVIDYAMDIVEVEGKPMAKRGKWSGSKRVLACSHCGQRSIIPHDGTDKPACACGGVFDDMLIPILDNGKELVAPEPAATIRDKTLRQVEALEV